MMDRTVMLILTGKAPITAKRVSNPTPLPDYRSEKVRYMVFDPGPGIRGDQ